MSQFRIAIVDRDTGRQVLLVPGGVAERDLVEDVVDAVLDRGVGFFRTEAQVEQAIRDSMREVLRKLKSDVKAPPRITRRAPAPRLGPDDELLAVEEL
jgi:hypothetical protein